MLLVFMSLLLSFSVVVVVIRFRLSLRLGRNDGVVGSTEMMMVSCRHPEEPRRHQGSS